MNQYYRNLFAAPEHCDDYARSDNFPTIEDLDARNLSRPVSLEETRATLKSMGDYKALGPDGFHIAFFKYCWDVVGTHIHNMVNKAFAHDYFPPSLNITILVLIPKVDHPQSIKDYRPISLCNVVYKIISKVIVNRIKHLIPSIISLFQASFVPN